MNTQEKQSSNVPASEISKNQILNMDDDFLNSEDPEDPEEDEDEDVDDEDLEEEAENSVDNPGNDFNEIEKEIDEEVE
jgi:hypothetical protein